jgi:hypothetical protein
MERFLYRISNSKHAQSVILKGALLLKTMGIPMRRWTMCVEEFRSISVWAMSWCPARE